ncbi:hypothetical protein NDU88_003645 [Pleurodeles waltl]|uniref:CD109 antigen n=1 Tax=Pleurodeles waltl TaxID=8319 RepID=A0AAV7RGT5_PLEWA|nr:hypothetical protein NDU88_003645 [Pleurodeles waltl]
MASIAGHLVLLLASWVAVAAARPTYLITTPAVIRPGQNITLGISLLAGNQSDVRVTAEIMRNNDTVLRGEGLFTTGSFGALTLPALPMNSVAGVHTLYVEGYVEDQLVFSNSTSLEFQSKGCFVFIQTDKSKYKPGQEVKMRFLTVFLDLKPYEASLNIHIRDPRGNLIEQWLEEQSDLGVVSQTFQLSEHPPLGDWSIQVQVNKQNHFQTFTVMEYVLPKFEVLLATPLHHSVNKSELTGTITAKYTYGKPVKGTAVVTLFPESAENTRSPIKKTYEINGSVKFSFGTAELNYLIKFYKEKHGVRYSTMYLDIVAVVTETLTGISQNTSSQIMFTEHDYVIEFSDYPAVLKPSLNFTAKIKIKRHDNSLLTVEERANTVEVTVEQSTYHRNQRWIISGTEREKITPDYHTVPENGIVQIDVTLMADTKDLQIKASFMGTVQHLRIENIFSSPSMAYIQIEKQAQDLKVGIPFELVIQSNKPSVELNYQVVSRGQIVAVGKNNLSAFTLTPESSWTPVALLIVYYIQDDGEVVNDVMSLPIQPVFENKVSLSWSRAVARPSEKVSLNMIASESNSLIGLSVADKSVKLLGYQNDITTSNVIQELKDISDPFQGLISNSLEVFEKCHLRVLTDANLVKEDTWNLFGPGYNYDYFYAEMDNMFVDELTSVRATLYDKPLGEIPPKREFPETSSTAIRVFFPETWIWMNRKTGHEADASLEVTVPDTITTWIASAFVISENLGLGIAEAPAKLQAFQPFFISLNLPYSVTRGEQFILEVTIFNYLAETTEVTVTLDPSDAFDFIFTTNDISATTDTHIVSVPSEDGRTVVFPIKTNQIGEIEITVKATSPTTSDAITQKVLVKAEGIEQFFSRSILLDLTNSKQSSFTETLNFLFPSNVVPASEHAYIAVVGDILGPSINGLERLIQMPYGCGEQNMINFAPIIYILDYLTKTNQLTNEIEQQSILFLKEGYQRELLFQREDGSFSAFGASDLSGSTWLSAFVLRCFLQARSFINIDPSVLQKTITWMFQHQKRNGEFWEPGRLLNSEMKGGNQSPVTLTAYITLAIAAYPGHEGSSQFQNAIHYLQRKMDEGIADNYTLAIVTYALSLADVSQAKAGLNILNRRAEKTGDLRFWKTASSKLSDGWQPSSVDIELAAYVLLSHARQKRVAEGLPIMKWLSQQRNHLGGFSSTQDTILALEALSTIASLATVGTTQMSIFVSVPNPNNTVEFKVDDVNLFLFQKKQIEITQPLEMNVSAHGVGLAVFQLNVFYTVKEQMIDVRSKPAKIEEAFDLEVTVQDNKNDIDHMILNVCTRFLGTDTTSESGMVLMQVNLLSGFAPSPDSVSLNNLIKKVENGNENVNLYFDYLNQTKICVAIPAVRDSKVAYTQDASVSVVDYYEPKRRAERSYNSKVMQNLSPCVFCKKNCEFCSNISIQLLPQSPLYAIFTSLLIIHFIL